MGADNTYTDIINDECLRRSWLEAHRFTDAAITILQHSIERAVDRGLLGTLPTALVIWSMLRWEQKLAVAILSDVVADMRAFEAEVESLLIGDERAQAVDASRISEVASQSKIESDQLGHSYVGTEHLLLAACQVGDAGVRGLMSKYDLDHERLARALQDVLASDPRGDLQ